MLKAATHGATFWREKKFAPIVKFELLGDQDTRNMMIIFQHYTLQIKFLKSFKIVAFLIGFRPAGRCYIKVGGATCKRLEGLNHGLHMYVLSGEFCISRCTRGSTCIDLKKSWVPCTHGTNAKEVPDFKMLTRIDLSLPLCQILQMPIT